MGVRKIIHIDMDAYYAAIEQRDDPSLRGKPVIVGGTPGTRSVVSTCSYEARKFGVRSAMPSNTAKRLCPQGIFVLPRFRVYEKVSRQIREIFREYTDLVEPMSLDEAYLDVTHNKKEISSATIIAREIKKKIHSKTSLTASAGVSYNKFLAKVASDFKKPDGLTVVPPGKAEKFLENLDIRKFYGVGVATENRMRKLGINNGADLKKRTLEELKENFGKAGIYYYEIVRGIDERPVINEWERKSYGSETTYEKDLTDMDQIAAEMERLSEKVFNGTEKENLKGKTVTVKVRYGDFTTLTRSLTREDAVDSSEDIVKTALFLLRKTEAGKRSIRLLGVTLSNFYSDEKIMTE
ncbi:DNA polymerase IV, partial [candidate division WOR-3 bacterium]|nr:DNA polymerase IV [candidate division WOR-3 bacterium]